jgi:hypothetical protein
MRSPSAQIHFNQTLGFQSDEGQLLAASNRCVIPHFSLTILYQFSQPLGVIPVLKYFSAVSLPTSLLRVIRDVVCMI